MDRADPSSPPVEAWLQAVGVQTLCEWDVLVFLYRHHVSLLGGEHIARLAGYDTGAVVAALDRLEALGLVARSRVSQAVRLYQFTTPADPPRRDAVERLVRLAGHRAGRVLVAKTFRPADPPAPNNGRSRLRLGEGGKTWRRAI
jgi:hypothetical protein